ncbi:MAG: hypothetical protein RDU25_02795 [Patescibacteria group bacterium]|nr:hypothetical protein [Patescibacteria group bacterium]
MDSFFANFFQNMTFPWSLLIAGVVLTFAYLIKHVFSDALEEEKSFVWIAASFFVVYIIAAIAMSFLNPLDDIKSTFAASGTTVIQDEEVRIDR